MTADGGTVTVQLDGGTSRLSRREAAQLHDALGTALATHRTFFRTSGEHRADGSYVVSRRGADSAGNRKVFESFQAVERLFESLPATFSAGDVQHPGLSGSRRHMIVHHFLEHPAFDCELLRRQPLTVHKSAGDHD